MSGQFPFTASPHSVAIFFNGAMRTIPSTDAGFAELYEHLKQPKHDHATVERLVDRGTHIERLTVGAVRVVGNTVYYGDTILRTMLAERLISMLDAGFDVTNWANFINNVMANPSERSRTCLYEFLEKWNAPITEDGHFIAFKRVRDTFRDIHSNTMDNSPGSVVEIAREMVDDNPDQTCSNGLHVAATSYLGSFYASAHNYKVIACKVNPKDVVAVPRDYNSAKMRCCRYVVIGLAEEEFYNNAHKLEVFNTTALVKPSLAALDGRRICFDAMTFSQDWRRDALGEIAEGSYVTPTAFSGDDLPENKFMVGVVTATAANGEGLFVDVTWQDGTTSETLLVDRAVPLNSDVIAAFYVGAETVADEDSDDEGDDDADWDSDDEDDCDDEEVCDDCGEIANTVDGLCTACAKIEEDQRTEEFAAFCDAVDEADHVAETGLTTDGKPVFTHKGVTYSADYVRDGVRDNGQRGFGRMTGVPRTTIQEWLKAIG